MWRPAHERRVLAMEGQTSRYAIKPRGEYVFGVVASGSLRAQRGRASYLVRPGQLVMWDASASHRGSGVDGPWYSRLIIVEVGGLASLAVDAEEDPLADVVFPQPVSSEPGLFSSFNQIHAMLKASRPDLEQDERLGDWLRTMVARSPSVRIARPARTPRDDRALRSALDYLGDRYAENIRLDELAAAAGIGKFRLVRLFREQTGLPPHSFLIAHRIRVARRLLEAGQTITATASATGFADQSHFHRHFRRSLGITPAQYQRGYLT
jgi:AraC-like DNA-binding protein